MDLGMPFAHKEAWVKLKRCVDQYAQITGNEVACVTAYMPMNMDKHGNNTEVFTNQSTTIHGHGSLLKLVRDGLDVAKRNNNEGHSHGSFDASFEISNGREPHRNGHVINGGTNSIAINSPRSNGTHHDQSVARSLSSSYRSLRLDHPLDNGFNRFQAQNWKVDEERESSSQRSSKAKKKSRTSSKTNRENLELDENLMFGEDLSEEESNSDDSDNESADFSGNSYDRPPMLFNAPRRPQPSQQSHSQIAASLPVTISRNWGGGNENGMKFCDNQGPHPPLTYIKAKPPPQTTVAPTISHAHQRSQDTPNPETMMASMQALARSVTNDSALIFGERPRPRLNTGESKMPINRLR